MQHRPVNRYCPDPHQNSLRNGSTLWDYSRRDRDRASFSSLPIVILKIIESRAEMLPGRTWGTITVESNTTPETHGTRVRVFFP
jgi:hypothetical protein